MRRRILVGLTGAILGAGLIGCADGPEPEEPGQTSRFGLDDSISCPEGEIGWRFPTEPLDPNSEEYALRTGDSSVVEITERYAVEVQSATCGGGASAEIGPLRNDCAGSVSCRYSPQCAQAFEVTYTCGASDKDESGAQRSYTATAAGGAVELSCTQPAEEAVEVATRTECVPVECHGRARRDLNMQCVENPAATDVAMFGGFETYLVRDYSGRGFNVPYIVEHFKPQTQRNANVLKGFGINFEPPATIYDNADFGPGKPIYPGLPYTIKLWAEFSFGIIPPTSSVVAWMSDVYENGETKEVVRGFRCVAFTRDIEPETAETVSEDGSGTRISIEYRGVMADACTNGQRASEDNAARKLGLSVAEFREQYDYVNTEMRASYDMEGRAAWHKVDFNPDLVEPDYLASNTPECVPNPQDFFYDAETSTYDLIAYYSQREFVTPVDVHFVDPSVGRRAYIVPGDIDARADITIRTQSQFDATLPIDLNWSAVNLNQENPFHPWAEGVNIGGAWEEGQSMPEANFGPTNLRASVFMVPLNFQNASAELFNFKIGEIPLTEPNPEGKTESVNLPITERVKRFFTRQASQAYIPGDSRLFRLFYCIESDEHPDRPNQAFKTRDGTYWGRSNGEPRLFRRQQNYTLSEYFPDPSSAEYDDEEYYFAAYSLELDTPALAENAFNPFRRPLRGCRAATGAVQVNIDRFTTPLEPISAEGFTGTTKTTETGDRKMSGENDNDSEVNCSDAGKQDCVEAINGGNRTDGESGRSTYDLNSRLGRDPGSEVSSSMTAEMLGFQLIDPNDPEAESVSFPDAGSASSQPVTIRLAPDWDGIKAALERANTGSAAEWETGRYGGQMGLGVGWGYKWRFKIGPVPVLVTFSFTVGASVALDTELQFAPTADQAYPCTGTESCVLKVNEPAGFREAARACNVRGGRLAELSSQAEATAVDQNRAGEEVWLGAQLAYRHDKPACATNFNAGECVPESQTEFRWMSNSEAFASNKAQAPPTYTTANLFNATPSGLVTRYPYESAVVYRTDGTLGSVDVNMQKPYLCVFEPAAEQDFFRWQMALNMGAAAGFNLTGCVPNDNPGFCLGAGFNVVAFNIGPVLENVYHWLYRAGEDEPFSRRGNTNISVPWSLKLFQGAVTASFNFLWFSFSWNLASYDGITAAEGTLYDADSPVIESLE